MKTIFGSIYQLRNVVSVVVGSFFSMRKSVYVVALYCDLYIRRENEILVHANEQQIHRHYVRSQSFVPCMCNGDNNNVKITVQEGNRDANHIFLIICSFCMI